MKNIKNLIVAVFLTGVVASCSALPFFEACRKAFYSNRLQQANEILKNQRAQEQSIIKFHDWSKRSHNQQSVDKWNQALSTNRRIQNFLQQQQEFCKDQSQLS